jgi:hypothetical protein
MSEFVPDERYAKWVARASLSDGEGVTVELPNGDNIAVYANGQVRHIRFGDDGTVSDTVIQEVLA